MKRQSRPLTGQQTAVPTMEWLPAVSGKRLVLFNVEGRERSASRAGASTARVARAAGQRWAGCRP